MSQIYQLARLGTPLRLHCVAGPLCPDEQSSGLQKQSREMRETMSLDKAVCRASLLDTLLIAHRPANALATNSTLLVNALPSDPLQYLAILTCLSMSPSIDDQTETRLACAARIPLYDFNKDKRESWPASLVNARVSLIHQSHMCTYKSHTDVST